MASTMVIKVKHRETLRRFSALVDENDQLDLDLGRLKAKISGLFSFSPDADLTLTYIDEDGDVVTLADDDDLRDVMRQQLKFLRIDVQLRSDLNGKSDAKSSGSSTPLRTPKVEHILPNINSLAEVLKSLSVPETVDALSKLSLECASNAASSSPVFADIVDYVVKLGHSLNPDSHSMSSTNAEPKASDSLRCSSSLVGSKTSKSGVKLELLSNSKCSRSNSKSNQKVDATGGLGGGSTPAPVSVNLNLPPADCIPSGSTLVDSLMLASTVCAGEGRKETNQGTRGKSAMNACGNSTVPRKFVDSSPPKTTHFNTSPSPTPFNECPFTGMPVYPVHPCKRIHSEAMGGIFHKNVICDGCGGHPIVGPRFKSLVKENFDLCNICFSEMGNKTDYIRIERPMSARPPPSLKELYEKYPWASPPVVSRPLFSGGCRMKPFRPKLDGCFSLDVNVLDGTIIAPGTSFTKIWRMRNNGSLMWPKGTQLVWIGGDKFSDSVAVDIGISTSGVPLDNEYDIAVDFTAPELPGRYISYWRMASPSGQTFGQRVWVLIHVDSFLKESSDGSSQDLNLNLPPQTETGETKGPEIIDVNAVPEMDLDFIQQWSSNSNTDVPKATVSDQPLENDEVQHDQTGGPKDDEFLYCFGTKTPLTAEALAISDVDFSEEVSTVKSSEASSAGVASSERNNANNNVEEALLKELEEMGFKQIDLNKEILRMNDFNLEQSVDDLCGDTEWYPILEELEEMGFCDKKVNKKLLVKNNGSIKRVVMDLISGNKG